ncbi:DnaB-like helicase N-terminal domain-containing protein [Nocardiopsis changdeensis]|uniref:DnaB-like helicase N-terminal domain-containing protein n=1 Tax=Nocardiopsis changdeensis TaxID=2831969 RepID=UPI003B973757
MSPHEDTRVPPHDLQAEQSVLGGMMLSADAAVDVMAVLAAGHFYRPAHQVIYTTICSLMDQGEPVDVVSVNAELTRRGESERVGGALYLYTLANAVPTAANAGYYARIVFDHALLRRLIEVGTRAAQLGYAAQGDPVDLVDAVQGEILAITQTQTKEEDPLLRPTTCPPRWTASNSARPRAAASKGCRPGSLTWTPSPAACWPVR